MVLKRHISLETNMLLLRLTKYIIKLAAHCLLPYATSLPFHVVAHHSPPQYLITSP